VHFEYLSHNSYWVKWQKGDRFPTWEVGGWRVVGTDGKVLIEGDFNGCFWFMYKSGAAFSHQTPKNV
jgi:hypothetical protein